MMVNFKFKIRSNRIQISNIRQLLFILIIVFTLGTRLPREVFAQDSTSSATEASASTIIKQKVEDLKKEIASRAANLKQTVNKKLENKMIAGKVISSEEGSLTLEGKNGPRVIKYNEYTNYHPINAKKGSKLRPPKPEDFSAGDFVVALGDLDDKSVLAAKKIVDSKETQRQESAFVWGQIESVKLPVIVIKQKDGSLQTITTGAKTAYFLGIEEASFADAKLGKSLAGRVIKDKSGQMTAGFIYFIPQAGFAKPEGKTASDTAKISTPSAKQASPSAKPKK